LSFREFNQSKDIISQQSIINEIVPLTGTLFSGSALFYTKNYINIVSGSAVSGGFYTTVFDGSPSSVSASALIDITYGISSASAQYLASETFVKTEKNRVYKQLAGLLLGNEDSIFSFNSVNHNDIFFLLFKRRIFKDELRKGQFSINLQVSGTGGGATTNTLSLTDTGATTTYNVGPAGDNASLYSGSTEVGKVYYNAGIVAISTGAFASNNLHWSGSTANRMNMLQSVISGNIDSVVYGLKNRINQITFQNQTNLHSTIYFCRALNSDFNYSTNPTFIDSEGRIIPTSGTDNQTRAYITTVGLYDINDNLLAVAKTSEPIKKSPDTELVFRVRLSY
jgi:hypothetical protein